MGTAVVATRNEEGLGLGDAAQRGAGGLGAGHLGGIAGRPDEEEIVGHHLVARQPEALGDEALLGCAVMHHQHVEVAAPTKLEDLAGAMDEAADLDESFELLMQLKKLKTIEQAVTFSALNFLVVAAESAQMKKWDSALQESILKTLGILYLEGKLPQ